MPVALSCPRGHPVDLGELEHTLAPGVPVACPICGEPVGHEQTPMDTGTLVQADRGPADTGTLVQPEPGSNGFDSTAWEGPRSSDEIPGEPDDPDVPGFEILGKLGVGGMGAVYRARQIQTDRVVALKVPHAARSDLAARLRFATEAKAVARLQHPGIVQVFEVGETADRLPYMALEFCGGGSLADKLDGTPLPAKSAATLAAAVARAVAAAHAAGVVHRDLKPGNVLLSAVNGPPSTASNNGPLTVDGGPVPKVADFGLARRFDVDQGQTQTGSILGTPAYMAPEQANGQTAGPPADVWAVGVMLYELLVGRSPFRGASILETLDLVRGQEPVPPSRLQPKVPRDLETVCLKCLEKDPVRRYPTAAELADDLRRFLDGQPVAARPVGWAERMAKRARRNPLPTGLLAGLVLAILAGMGFGVWRQVRVVAERDRARGHFQMSLRAIDGLLTEVGESDLAAEPRAEATRRALLKKALAFYEDLLRTEVGDLSLEWEAARAARRVGDIHRLLGEYPQALAAYADAEARLTPLAAAPPPGTDPLRELALCHTYTGEVYRLSERPDAADAAYRRAVDLQQPLFDARPADPNYRRELAQSLYNRGIVAGTAGRFADARELFTRAAELLDVATDCSEARRHRARVYLNLSNVLWQDKKPAEAVTAAERGVELLDGIADQKPEYRHELSAALLNLANARADAARSGPAKAAADRGRMLLEELVRDFPSTPGYRVELARGCNTSAALAFRAGDRSTAEGLVRQAVGHWEALLAVQPGSAPYRGELGMALGNLAKSLLMARPAEARDLLKRGVGEVLAGLRANPDEPSFRQSLRRQTRDLADLLVAAGEHDAARKQAEAIAAGLPGHPHGTQRAVGFLARCVTAVRGRPDAARQTDEYTRLAVELVRRQPSAVPLLKADPDCDPLRPQPSFAALFATP